MRKIVIPFIVLSLTFATACKNKTMKSTDAKVPLATKEAKKLKKHGDLRVDDYFWMRLSDDQKNALEKDAHTKKVVSYLEEENVYYNEVTKPTKPFQEELF